MDKFMNPFQLLPVKKGVMLTAGVENKTLRNNPYYAALWK